MSKKEWLKCEVEELIRSYESKSVLWDIATTDYKNRSKKRDALEQLALKFDTLPEEISRKIHNLRNQFIAELKKIAKGLEKNEPYVSRWPHFASLTFLQATMHLRTSGGNVLILDELPLYTDDRAADEKECKIRVSDSHQNTYSSHRSSIAPRKRRFRSIEDDHQFLDSTEVIRDVSSNSHRDEFEVFALSIATQMRQLPLQDALELQAEIQNLVVQKRIKVLNSMRHGNI